MKIRPIDAEAKDEEWGDGEGEVGDSAADDSLKLRFRRLRRREISLSGRLMETRSFDLASYRSGFIRDEARFLIGDAVIAGANLAGFLEVPFRRNKLSRQHSDIYLGLMP